MQVTQGEVKFKKLTEHHCTQQEEQSEGHGTLRNDKLLFYNKYYINNEEETMLQALNNAVYCSNGSDRNNYVPLLTIGTET